MKSVQDLQKFDKVKGIKMISDCFGKQDHDCTVIGITFHGSRGSQISFKCDDCGRIKHVNNPS